MFASRTSWNLAPNRFSIALEKHRAGGQQIFDLTVSNPTDCGLEFSETAILQPLTDPASLIYKPEAQGLLASRAAIADYYLEKNVKVAPEDMILTTSTSEAYSFIFRLLCEPGDEVLIPQPSYPLFQFLADIQDVSLVPYPLIYDHGWQIDPASIHGAVTSRSRAIIVVNPNNPTGSYLKTDELRQLNRLCQTHDLAIISDEVFHDYPLAGIAPASCVSNQDALTFTLSGLSKVSGLPQMKVAWLAISGPDNLRRQAIDRLDVIADTFLSMNAPMQHGLRALLGYRKEFQGQLLARLKKNLAVLDAQLAAQRHCTRLGLEGGWYAILRVPVTRSDEDLAVLLLEEDNVLVQPGHFFDFPQEGYLVLSLMTPATEFSSGLARILARVSVT